MNYKNFTFIEHPRVLYFFGFFAFIIGIISAVNKNFIITLVSVIFLIVFAILFYKKFFEKIIIILLFFVLWNFLTFFEISERLHNQEVLQNITENFSWKFLISGTITDTLYTSDFTKTFRLKIDTIDNHSTKYIFQKDDNIGIFVSIPKNLTLHNGEQIELESKLFPTFSPENITEFGRYSYIKKVYARANISQFVRKNISENPFISTKEKVKQLISKGFPQDISALILGITIGNTDFINSEMKDDFKNSGLTHILVVSGSNITFVIIIITFFLKYIPLHRYVVYSIIGGFLFAYGGLVWWEIPVIRATIMGILSYIAISGWKKLHSLSFLFAIASIFLIFDPLTLLYDASFGLSFSATLGILLFNKPIENFLKKFISFNFIVTSISVTLAASIGSFGVLIYHFGSFSFSGIFANILVAGIMWLLLILSTFYIFLAFWIPQNLVYIFGFAIYFIAEYVLWITKFFGNISLIEIPENIKTPLVVGWYFAIFLYILQKDDKNRLLSKKVIHRNGSIT